MSGNDLSWYHCGRCGSLFQSGLVVQEPRLCTKCGFDPSPVYASTVAEIPPLATVPGKETRAKRSETLPQRGKRLASKPKNRYITLKLIAGWTAILTLIVLAARQKWRDEEPARPTQAAAAAASKAVPETDNLLLREAGQPCVEAFSGYLASSTPEERNQFVLSPITTASRMVRFYSQNPSTTLDPQTLSLSQSSVLHFPSGVAIETLWKSGDGKQVDAVFREENGEWRLDWDHFARFSDYPWPLYLAGTGDPEGEFRLLARERLAAERKDEKTISIVLYAPRFSQPGQAGFQSPEFLISRESRDGRMLDAAFKLARSGGRVFGSRLSPIDPDGMIRVRVKIRRAEVDGERKFELTGVSACHWYSEDAPGIDLQTPEPPPKETPNP